MTQLDLFSGKLATARPRPLPMRAPSGTQYRFSEYQDRFLLDRTALTIERIANVLRNAEAGRIEEMADLFEGRIEADAHLRAALENRNESVSLKPWTIVEGGDSEEDKRAANELELRLRLVPGFSDTLGHQLLFAPFGWSASEIDWDLVDGMAAPTFFTTVPHKRFTFAQATDELRLVTEPGRPEGVPLTPGKWWVTYRGRGRLVATAGYMRTAVWWSTFKTMSVRDWMIFANRFGIPFVTGEYDETISDDDKEILRQAARDLGTDGFAIFSQQAKLVIHEMQRHQTGNAAEGIHGALMTICDLQMSKLIEGATLVSEVQGPGSHALGTVHENRYHDILEGDAEKISESFQAAVGVPFVRFNGLKARPPRLKLHLRLNLSLRDQIGIALDLANRLEGFELDEEQIRSMTLLRRPRTGSAGLRGLEVAKLEQAAQDAKNAAEQTDPAGAERSRPAR
jgi:phage gp29-like protein